MRPDHRPRRVLAYARVSSVEQGTHGTSLEAQREEIARYCAAFGYPDPTFFVEVESGAGEKREARVQQQRLVAMAAAGDLVIVSKIDRWSRDTIYFLNSVDSLSAAGASFLALAERFDPTTPEGRLAATMMASFAEHERLRIKERTVGSRRRLRRLGFWVEGAPPLGYRVADRKLVVDPETAPIVRRMFALCLDGSSSKEIAEVLAVEYPETLGLDRSAVAKRLRDRRYLGENPVSGKRHRRRPGPEVEWVRSHDALVDVATWRRAQDAITRRTVGGAKAGEMSRNAHFLLRGIAHCGNCGHVLVAHAPMPYESIRHDGYYTCRYRKTCSGPTARRDQVDAQVSAKALARVEELRTLLAKPAKKPPREEVRPAFELERTREERRRARVIDAIADGTLSREDARAKLGAIDDAIVAIERREVEYATRRRVQSPTERRAMLQQLDALREVWAAMSPAEMRKALRLLALRITITRPPSAKPWARSGAWNLEIIWKERA